MTTRSGAVVGFVPSKLNSSRLPAKNIRPLCGRPLVNYALQTLAAVPAIDRTVIYASDERIMSAVEPASGAELVLRPHQLDSDDATVQDFVGGFLRDVDAAVVVLLHVTSPFISPQTVATCVDKVLNDEYESAFAAIELQRFAWFRGQPLNYRLDAPTPRTQDLDPVLVEQSGLYVFTRELFERTGRRIADAPYVHVVGAFEGHDIDTPEEFEFAEFLMHQRSDHHDPS